MCDNLSSTYTHSGEGREVLNGRLRLLGESEIGGVATICICGYIMNYL